MEEEDEDEKDELQGWSDEEKEGEEGRESEGEEVDNDEASWIRKRMQIL